MTITLGLAAILAASADACPVADLPAQVRAVHEVSRQAHLRGDAELLVPTLADELVSADGGGIRRQSRAQVLDFFRGYFSRVKYAEWKDVSAPIVTVAADGSMAWMAVEISATYTRTDRPAEGSKTFKSSWIATFQRERCAWQMTGIASNIVS